MCFLCVIFTTRTGSAFPLTATHVRTNESSVLPHGLYNLLSLYLSLTLNLTASTGSAFPLTARHVRANEISDLSSRGVLGSEGWLVNQSPATSRYRIPPGE